MEDPTNIRASYQSKRRLPRETIQKRINHPPDSSSGGTHGFSIWKRQRALAELHITANYYLAADRIGCLAISVQR